MENDKKYGLLINESNIKLHRFYFREMVRLLGINCIYRAPLPNKHYTNYAEIDSNYAKPMITGVIFNEHPTQQTLKKLGWMSELQKDASIIECDYDLPDIQQGALFIIPSAIDNTKGRVFRVSKINMNMIYPASLICEIVPEYTNTFDSSLEFHGDNSLNILEEEEEPNVLKG